MAKSRRPAETPKAETPNATRQMLDELDALMERMLALPVNDLSEPAPALPREIVESPARTAQLDQAELSDSVGQEVACEELASEPSTTKEPGKILVGRLTPSYMAEVEEPAPPPSATQSYAFSPEPAVESSAPRPLPSWRQSEPAPSADELLPPLTVSRPVTEGKRYPRRRSLGQWLMQPLLWLNRRFDRATRWLGGLGHWLRGSAGRMLLGYMGIALFALAIAWVLRDWLRWGW